MLYYNPFVSTHCFQRKSRFSSSRSPLHTYNPNGMQGCNYTWSCASLEAWSKDFHYSTHSFSQKKIFRNIFLGRYLESWTKRNLYTSSSLRCLFVSPPSNFDGRDDGISVVSVDSLLGATLMGQMLLVFSFQWEIELNGTSVFVANWTPVNPSCRSQAKCLVFLGLFISFLLQI